VTLICNEADLIASLLGQSPAATWQMNYWDLSAPKFFGGLMIEVYHILQINLNPERFERFAVSL
jgi:hypothetical protein